MDTNTPQSAVFPALVEGSDGEFGLEAVLQMCRAALQPHRDSSSAISDLVSSFTFNSVAVGSKLPVHLLSNSVVVQSQTSNPTVSLGHLVGLVLAHTVLPRCVQFGSSSFSGLEGSVLIVSNSSSALSCFSPLTVSRLATALINHHVEPTIAAQSTAEIESTILDALSHIHVLDVGDVVIAGASLSDLVDQIKAALGPVDIPVKEQTHKHRQLLTAYPSAARPLSLILIDGCDELIRHPLSAPALASLSAFSSGFSATCVYTASSLSDPSTATLPNSLVPGLSVRLQNQDQKDPAAQYNHLNTLSPVELFEVKVIDQTSDFALPTHHRRQNGQVPVGVNRYMFEYDAGLDQLDVSRLE